MSEVRGPEGEDLASLTGLYALDALEGDQLVRFEAYLVEHPEASDEVAGFRATAAELTTVVAQPPPAALRDRVLAEVAATRQDAPVVDLASRRSRLPTAAWLAAAAVVLLAVVGGLLLARGGATPADEVAALLARDDLRVVALAGTGPHGAKVVWSPSARRAAIVAEGVDPLPEDRTFELWRLDDGEAAPVGLFRPDGDGRVRRIYEVDLRGADGLGVTREPAGGSPRPTPPILLQGTLD